MKNSQRSRKPNLGVFHVSCWVLGLVAFIQMMAVGVAMAFRSQRAPESEERIVKEYVMVPAERPAPISAAVPKLRAAPIAMLEDEDLMSNIGAVADVSEDEIYNTAPPVLDPILERLLQEASEARIRGDLYLAHNKLSEAQLHDPKNPNVLYGMGANYEEFGVWDKAAPFFLEVYQAGLMKAGSLYEKAAIKLATGSKTDVKDLAKLGWGRMTTPVRDANGEKRTLILPVKVAPSRDFDPDLFNPVVRFYEEADGQVFPALIQEGGADHGSEWVTGLRDWKDIDGEEMAEIWYYVPNQDPATGLLFGEREFHGFVAELYYDGRLVDICAQPRTLLRIGGGKSTVEELQREFDELDGLDIDDLTAGSSLLPKKTD
ncbi:MAG: hypothetical protein QNK82_05145 [Akkermansiaceae bacterium]|jgi:hypothetical protein